MEGANGKPPQGGEDGKEAVAPVVEGSIGGYESLHRLLESNLSPELFKEASRLLLGLNCACPLESISLPEATNALAEAHNFDVQAFRFNADKEFLRQPRVVRIGLIQNSIAVPTSCHFADQKKAIMDKVKPIIDAAGASGVDARASFCLPRLAGSRGDGLALRRLLEAVEGGLEAVKASALV